MPMFRYEVVCLDTKKKFGTYFTKIEAYDFCDSLPVSARVIRYVQGIKDPGLVMYTREVTNE